ncbi:EAL domain-containing protein [Ideonella sp. 4Y16]|uniref:putative bifunctional diguanylate cyclase/phosphodiesterase n=1 Tax=Ideonella alba TaxID=2824118 RepID=UPI001B367685|nr:EAL domain-containing protein [Ideonella alba]MBQ0944713.1 EAL domain-containing protein [Ideonella alba]
MPTGLLDPGQGLNSIRWRFALAGGVLGALAALGSVTALGGGALGQPRTWAVVAGAAVGVGAAIFWMASRLTNLVDALRRSTEAIADGDFGAPVEVDCACEIGGLANSFRRMRSRLNDNVLRINLLAYTDPITRLPNRSVVDRLLNFALDPSRSETYRAAIIFIDLDGFKRVNDTLGHAGGDALLAQAAERLLQQGLGRDLHTIDTCLDAFGTPCDRLPRDVVFARFAGDEFVAILPGTTDRAELAEIGERIVRSLAAPFSVQGQEVTVGASLGIAITPDDSVDPKEILAFADLAMYGSKQAGKSRYQFFDQQARQALLDATRIEAELRVALEQGQLRLHFQPKFQLRDGQLSGVEALVRWAHPTRGLLLPGAFIDIAERSGLMGELGRQVLTMAVAQCRQWMVQGRPLNVAVNVSPSQFSDPHFCTEVLEAIEQAGIPAELLSIEITESMAMTDFAATAARLARLRAAGVMIALDDFGIGFSNLSQLSRLPLDILKVDRSLVSALGTDPRADAIVRAIIGMAHALSCRVIAEGIETEPQRAHVRDLGCDCGQGFLLGRPVPADAVVLLPGAAVEPALAS